MYRNYCVIIPCADAILYIYIHYIYIRYIYIFNIIWICTIYNIYTFICDITKTAAKYFTEEKYFTVYDETNYSSLIYVWCHRIINNLWMWHHQNPCNYSLVDQNFRKMSANRAIWYGYMPKTNPIAGKAYKTSLDKKIEDLKLGSACPAHTRIFFFPKIWP